MERPRIHECVFSLAGVPLTLALSAAGGYRGLLPLPPLPRWERGGVRVSSGFTNNPGEA